MSSLYPNDTSTDGAPRSRFQGLKARYVKARGEAPGRTNRIYAAL